MAIRTVLLRIIETRNGSTHKMWDFRVPFSRAENLCGHKLDHRKSYAIIQGIVSELIRWTDDCSGCSELDEGVFVGAMGCDECGYTGKRIRAMFVPIPSQGHKYWERQYARSPVLA